MGAGEDVCLKRNRDCPTKLEDQRRHMTRVIGRTGDSEAAVEVSHRTHR